MSIPTFEHYTIEEFMEAYDESASYMFNSMEDVIHIFNDGVSIANELDNCFKLLEPHGSDIAHKITNMLRDDILNDMKTLTKYNNNVTQHRDHVYHAINPVDTFPYVYIVKYIGF